MKFNDHYSVFGMLMARTETATCIKCGHTNLIRWRVGYVPLGSKPETTRPDAKCEQCNQPLPEKVHA